MLSIHVRFLRGAYRASEGEAREFRGPDVGDWPVSPARLLSALTAARGTARFNGGATTDADLRQLAAAEPPVIYADPDVCWNRSLPRYGPSSVIAPNTHQEYPGRQGVLLSPSPVASLRVPELGYEWPDVALSDADFDELSRRAARVGYLGCSDSAVAVTVARSPLQPAASGLHLDDTTRWEPADGQDIPGTGDVLLRVADKHEVDILDHVYEHQGAMSAARARPHQPKCWYRSPGSGRAADQWTAWTVDFEHGVSGRLALKVTKAFKDAVLGNWPGGRDTVPDWAHGHIRRARPYQPGCFLALPNVFSSHPDGRILGAAVAAPPDASPDELGVLRDALREIDALHIQGDRTIRTDRSRRRRAATRWQSWTREARAWTTVLPAVSDRHQRVDSETVRRWCVHAGLPEPSGVAVQRQPFFRGAVDLHPSEVRVPGHMPNTKPYAHARLEFDEPVRGPVVLGSLRTMGLGLCMPERDPAT